MLNLCPDTKLWCIKGVSFHSTGSHSHATEIVLVERNCRTGESKITCFQTGLCKGNITTDTLCLSLQKIKRNHINNRLCNIRILCFNILCHLLHRCHCITHNLCKNSFLLFRYSIIRSNAFYFRFGKFLQIIITGKPFCCSSVCME